MCNRPKVIIVEGPDRVGKDSLIKRLSEHFNNKVKVIHAGIPTSKDLYSYYYNGLLHDTLDAYYSHQFNAIIHNRSIYGEYVYGTKYRNESPAEIRALISKLEIGQLKSFILNSNLYLVLLTCDDVNVLLKNDDGLSISSKQSDIENEIALFNDIFELSTIKNKIKVTVNSGNTFRSKDDVYKSVIDFIEN